MAESRPFVDFKAIKGRIGIADVLARYQVNLVRVNQTSLKGACPLPTHSSGSKNTFFVNVAKSVWYCHSDSCKKNGNRAGGNIIDFVSAKEGLTPYEAAVKLNEWFPQNQNALHEAGRVDDDGGHGRNQIHDRQDNPNPSPPEINLPLAFALKDVNPSHPMIQEHGISAETAKIFGVGFFPGKGSMAGRIVFPLHENRALVGYAGRTTLPVSETNPKWLFGKGLKKSFVYGLERCDPAKPVILCESLWAPLWFCEHGHQAASLMGSEMTEEQERCLDPYPVITVALDNDAAGMGKASLICGRLKKNHSVLKARLIG